MGIKDTILNKLSKIPGKPNKNKSKVNEGISDTLPEVKKELILRLAKVSKSLNECKATVAKAIY